MITTAGGRWLLDAPAGSASRRRASRAADAVAVVAGLWLVVALFSDGWAHANVPDLEGFFTPWHAALYAGLAVNTAWIGWLGWADRSSGWRRALPAGYGWGAVGAAVFAAGGVADMA